MPAPLVGVTMGDPCGIGPEIVVKALTTPELERHGCRFAVLGCPAVIAEMVERLGISENLTVIPTATMGPVGDRFGKVLVEAGRAALQTIEAAADQVCTGRLAAVATAPVSKESLHLAGCTVPGHAELFARRAGVERVATMLMHGDFRVVHLSTHVSLRRACDLVRRERIVAMTDLTVEALRAMGIERPRIAVAALNPHGGDGGLFGTEELEQIAPAVADLQARGVDAAGPIPADIVFSQARGGLWDAVLAMYHDQGHIPIKTASFVYDRRLGRWTATGGVTLTLGLPFARTSVDHGTAFDVAGRGVAEPSAMVGAIELAALMASRGPSDSGIVVEGQG